MASGKRLICQSSDVLDGGDGVRFTVLDADGAEAPAFVIRHSGMVSGYLNRCAHIQVELDWQHGRFFDDESQLLVCATHGALYLPSSGECVGGPCKGDFLTKIEVREKDGMVYLINHADSSLDE